MKTDNDKDKTEDFLSENSRAIVTGIMELFSEVDARSAEFVAMTGISCPEKCGKCCASSAVETTAMEMMPLAEELWKKGEAEKWLDRINSTGAGKCVFFQEDPDAEGNGRCVVYRYRPLICRLFGFFTVKDKNGKYVYGSCKVIKEHYPEKYKKALSVLSDIRHPSNMTDYSIRVMSSGTDLGRRMLPINIAAGAAIEKTGFEKQQNSGGRGWTR